MSKRKSAPEDAEGQGEVVVASADGAERYVLAPLTEGRVYIERSSVQPGAAIVQSMLIGSISEFSAWQDKDDLRFRDPVLSDQLRRCYLDLASQAQQP